MVPLLLPPMFLTFFSSISFQRQLILGKKKMGERIFHQKLFKNFFNRKRAKNFDLLSEEVNKTH